MFSKSILESKPEKDLEAPDWLPVIVSVHSKFLVQLALKYLEEEGSLKSKFEALGVKESNIDNSPNWSFKEFPRNSR